MTFTDDEVDVFASEWTTFWETVWPAAVEDWLMPSIADEVAVPGFELVVDNLLTELPVRVLMPAVVTMPRICPELEELLLRFATVFPVILALVLLVLRIPVTCCPVEEVDEVAALRLLAVAVLPMVLPEIVFAPPVT
jgi:hypothetical protein